MKSRLTALLLTLALLLTALPVCAAAEETSSTRMPLYDVFRCNWMTTPFLSCP